MVTKSREIAKTGKNFLMSSFKKIFKANQVSPETRLQHNPYNKLVLFEQEQTEMIKILGKGIEEARRVRESLLRPTQEINPEVEGINSPELAAVLKDYCAVSIAAQAQEFAIAQEIQTEVIWKLEDMHQDSAQALKKLRNNSQIRVDLERELRGVGDHECEFRVEFQKENEKILSKEISAFSKKSDENIRQIMKSFVRICSKVSRGRPS